MMTDKLFRSPAKWTATALFAFCLFFSGIMANGQGAKLVSKEDMTPISAGMDRFIHYAPEQVNEGSQRILNSIVSLDLIDVSMEEALLDISKAANLRISYSKSVREQSWDRRITLNAEKATVLGALYATLEGTGLQVVLPTASRNHMDDVVVIKESDEEVAEGKTEVHPETVSQPADHQVAGSVVGEDGEPLVGVNIVVEGETGYGTTTNIQGEYSLTVPHEDATLIFSYVGFQTRTIQIDGRSQLDVQLVFDALMGEELVVVGYGQMRRTDMTGSVSSVSAEEIENLQSHSLDRLLQGRVPGLHVMGASGEPGEGVTMRIRGASSLHGSNSPLYVVDGFPMGDAGDLKQINPSDIQSIEVLKDASAAAIYGSRGANGVILITTYRDSGDRPAQISINIQNGISTLAQDLDIFRDPVHQAIVTNEARRNAGQDELYIGQNYLGTYYPSERELRSGEWPHQTDWQDEVYRNAMTRDYTISAEGGSEQTQYTFSGNYYSEEGLTINNRYDRMSGRVHVDQKVRDDLRLSANVNLALTDRERSSASYGRSPVFPVYDEDGDYFQVGPQDFWHPIALAKEVTNEGTTIDVIGSGKLVWNISPNLIFNSQLNYSYGESTWDNFQPSQYTNTGNLFNGFGEISNWKNNSWTTENYATYQRDFQDVHNLTVTLGATAENSITRTSNLEGRGFINETLGHEDLNAAEENTVNNSYVEERLMSGISRFNYVYDGRYLFTFTSRLDGSSKFGDNNKWAFFPSGAIGWNIHNEDFMSDQYTLSEAKIRFSYGLTGNQGISPYQTLDRLGTNEYYLDGAFVTAYGPGVFRWDDFFKIWSGIANPDLKWETTEQYNVGLELGFLNGRVDLTADLYHKRTRDLLRMQRLPISSGFDEIWVNDGTIDNRGFELAANIRMLNGPLIWNLGTMFSRNQNEVIGVGDTDFQFWGTEIEMFRTPVNVLKEGEPIFAFYGYKTDGIIQSEEEGLAAGLTGERAQPGEIKYVDLNGDGVVDADDRTIIGDPHPDFIFSISSDFYYRNFDLSVMLYGSYGGDVYNLQKFSTASAQLQRWTPDNPTNDYPSLNNLRGYEASDWWIEDGSFLRIQNLTLGYTLTDIAAMDRLRLYVNVDNLYTFTPFASGYDPEVGENGLNWGFYPRPRKWMFGINVRI